MTLTHHDYLSNPEYHNSQTYTAAGVYALPGTSAVDGSVGGAPASAHAYAAVDYNQVSTTNASGRRRRVQIGKARDHGCADQGDDRRT